MRRSPYTIAQHLKEILCTYLETAYRVSNQAIVDDRAALLREQTVISQSPFVETTPLFEQTALLQDIHLPAVPSELCELARIGVLGGRRPLYRHQQEAIAAAWDETGIRPRDLLVASGTGSGKTEIFYLTILSDILKEALHWETPAQAQSDMGVWHRDRWLHRRRFEQRPAAVRAIILYPMNALVNDQLRRLRRLLASDTAIQWQLDNLHGNLIYFGRYTSQTMLPGIPEVKTKRDKWESYLNSVHADWDSLSDRLKALGNMPRPNGPEMLARWNMQAAPPDILLTNYSMLEYMLLRPIEAPVFRATQEWLTQSPDNILTLVLDEAHSYSGARGTEVAYLIRRLYERFGVRSDQVRCIATSASLGEAPEELERGRQFAANLFDHPEDRFTIIQASVVRSVVQLPAPTLGELEAFAQFQRNLEIVMSDGDEADAAEELLTMLSLQGSGEDYIERMYSALCNQPRIVALRDLTARSATELTAVASRVWGNLGTLEQREQATAGLLAAGAIARPDSDPLSEDPPLLPSRIHLMFRGLPGLWACIDPNCSAVDQRELLRPRPCGRLYAEPRIWCECGARVVELLSCRTCGLLIGGGIEETNTQTRRVWPYEDDFEGGIGQYERYTIFALEEPGPTSRGQEEWAEVIRNTRTTSIENENSGSTRIVWEPVRDSHSDRLPIESPCPRCGQRKSMTRNAIEPLRTTGAQAFSALIEDAFRLQKPRYQVPLDEEGVQGDVFNWFADNDPEPAARRPPRDYNPNQGRKALVFSDSRQNAARLAGDLMYLHHRDLFRQLMLSVLYEGSGIEPIGVASLIDLMLNRAIELGIDPSFGELNNFWQAWEIDRTGTKNITKLYLETYLRREMADRQVGIEALGLARWVIPGVNVRANAPPITPFTSDQTIALMYATLRILAGENVIIPSTLEPEDWPNELVERYYRRLITLPANPESGSFIWEASRNNRLIRYLEAVLAAGNLSPSMLQSIMERLWEYFRGGNIAVAVAGNRPGYGISIRRFALASMPELVFVCNECKYISAETVNNVCLRCHQQSNSVPLDEAHAAQRNYYRLLSTFAQPDSNLPDPFRLKALEHTAQISTEAAARRECWFQDQFLSEEDALEHGVDILSVTTTMEMGIDIGDLTVVGLHNTPPTVANYQQRAGRAGRRSDGIAEVVTLARHRSHDQYYYDRIAEIVTGSVRIPTLHLNNHVIARRHINALVLQQFFADLQFGDTDTSLFEAFGTVGGLLDNDHQRLIALQEFIENPQHYSHIISSVDQMLSSSDITLSEAESWIAELSEQLQELATHAPANQLVLDLLIEKGLLPRYAFPVDVVALWVREPTRWNQGEEVQRDLSIALSEYAPGSEVIIDGMIYRSVGLFTPFEDEPDYSPAGWYYECPRCHHVLFADRQVRDTPPAWEHCSMCHEPVGTNPHYQIMPTIEPQGFRTSWRRADEKYRGGGQERAGYASPAQLVAGESSENGDTQFDDRLFVYRRTGDLYMVNRGPSRQEHPGFLICPRCGFDVDTDRHKPHNDPITRRPCHGGRNAQNAVLLHRFNTDIVLFGVNVTPRMYIDPRVPGGRASVLSLGTALRQGAAAHLQIDPEELAMGVRPWYEPNMGRLSAEVYLYDTLPNGAGYAIEIAADTQSIFERALGIVQECPEQCETACYRCLLEYGNQTYHPYIDRHLARDIISYAVAGIEPELGPDSAIEALGHLEAFAREIDYQITSDPVLGLIRSPVSQRVVTLIPTHTLRPYDSELEERSLSMGQHPVFVSHFDLTRRPFWVWDRLMPIIQGRSDKSNLS